MKVLTLVSLPLGLALFVVVLLNADLASVWHELVRLGWSGLCLVLILRFAAAIPDVGAWLLTFHAMPFNQTWLSRLFLVHTYGEALNSVTPLASLGGEPVKAAILKQRFRIGYREAVASLTLAQTINTLALVLFLFLTLLLAGAMQALPASQRAIAWVGVALLGAGVAALFAIQRFRVVSRIGGWIAADRGWRSLEGAVAIVHDVEERLIRYYLEHRRRLVASFLLAFATWFGGAMEVWLVLSAFGDGVTATEALVIHGAVLLVRTVLFVLPSSIGTQEATFVVVVGAITGSPSAAVALALVRRAREVAWIGLGLAIGARLTVVREQVGGS